MKIINIFFLILLECHKGNDGYYYVIDVARLFPPENSNPKLKGSFLYRLFRKEFVMNREYNPLPLSSDAFSYFGKDNHGEHNKEIEESTNKLMNIVIPQFSKELSTRKNLSIESINITKEIHNHGINIR